MLTVKHVTKNGDELVIECVRVLVERSKNVSPPPKQPEKVIAVEPDGRKEIFTSGTVYVMNDTGATVSQWMVLAPEKLKTNGQPFKEIHEGKLSVNEVREKLKFLSLPLYKENNN